MVNAMHPFPMAETLYNSFTDSNCSSDKISQIDLLAMERNYLHVPLLW